MKRVLAARPAGPPYRARVCRGRPWAVIDDADGFPEAGLNDYLTFVAWQDQPPRHCLHAAHDLANAATWLGFHHLTWGEADRAVWAAYCQDLAGERPDRAAWLAVYRATATLHRLYAFWHWRRWVRWQPFPGSQGERHEWLQAILPPPTDIVD
jgi:hypothetical protein